MQKELPKMRSVHMINLYLSVPKNLNKFLIEFRQILKENFQTITVEGKKRYTCGQEHTRLNPNGEGPCFIQYPYERDPQTGKIKYRTEKASFSKKGQKDVSDKM